MKLKPRDILDNYMTFTMALQMIGVSNKQNMRLYRLADAEENNIECVKIGHMNLLRTSDVVKALGGMSPNGEVPRWPVHLAILDINALMSVGDVAAELEISERHVYNLAEKDKILSHNLEHWGGQTVFERGSVVREKSRRGIKLLALQRKRTPRYLSERKDGK